MTNTKDEYSAFLGTDPLREKPLVIDVPPAPPTLIRRARTGLDRPYRGVGVESELYSDDEALGTGWQGWFVLGMAIAFLAPAGIGALLMGEGVLVLLVLPIAGLFLVGMVRFLLAGQKTKKKKRNKQLRRLRN